MADNLIELPLKIPPSAAAEWLKRKRELLQPGCRDDCHEWLLRVVAGLNGVDERGFDDRVEAIWEMCEDLPGLVWCKETRTAIWKRTSFLPTPGECREVMIAYLAPLLAEIAGLERLAAPGEPADPWGARVRAERAEVARDWSDPRKIEAAIAALDGVPMRLPLGRVLAAAVATHAPHLIDLVPVEFRMKAAAG